MVPLLEHIFSLDIILIYLNSVLATTQKKKKQKQNEKTKMIYEKMSTYVFVLYSF
jgi:hypothetical protein